MSVTALDPVTALVVIDLQRGIVSLPTAHPAGEIVQRASALASAFRRAHLPVVLVNVVGSAPGRTDEAQRYPQDRPADWSDLVPELGLKPTDHTLSKRAWGAFTNTGLEELLRSRKVTQIVLAGISTSIGVESTARSAYESGFNVTLAVDAMTDRNADAHSNSVTRIFPRLGETGSTAEILALLDRTHV